MLGRISAHANFFFSGKAWWACLSSTIMGALSPKHHSQVGQPACSFLSDPSPIIGHPCHSLRTDWMTHSVAFGRLDWCDPGVWICQLGHKAKLFFRLSAQGLVKILKLKFRRYFEAGVWSLFAADVWLRLRMTKLNLGQYSEARFGQDFNFKFSRDANVWLRFWS